MNGSVVGWEDVQLRYAAPLDAIAHGLRVTPVDGGRELNLCVPVDAAESYLAGHYPGFRILPGVFVIECVRQAVSAAFGDGTPIRLRQLSSVRFLAPLLPGDELRLEISARPDPATAAIMVRARCLRADGAVATKLSAEFSSGGQRHA